MKSAHLGRPSILLGALLVGPSAFAPETSAQSGSTPGRQLSNAVAEVLRSPFYGHRAPLGLGGQGLLLPAVLYPYAAQGREDWATSWSTGLLNAEAPLQEVVPSPNRLIGVTTLGAIASHITTALFLRCQFGYSNNDPGRYTELGRPDVIGFPPGEGESVCRYFNTGSELVAGGFLVLVPTLTTAGAATLAGSEFLRAVGGSALGFLGSFLFYGGMSEMANEKAIEDLQILTWFMGGLIHGLTAAYFSG